MGFDSPAAEVAARVRAEMSYQQRSQADLASALKLTQPAVSRKLSGRRPFTIDELVIVARLLGKPAAQFLPAEAVPA